MKNGPQDNPISGRWTGYNGTFDDGCDPFCGGHAELTETTRRLSTRFAWQEFRRMDEMVSFLKDPWAYIHAAAEDRQADHHCPHDRPHDVVREATEHLLNGRITSAPARKQLRDALDNADRAPVGPDWGRITRR